jgi:hypothetical protein
MPETVKADVCHRLRTEIYRMIFPRWALFIAGGLVVSALAALHAKGNIAEDKVHSSKVVQAKLVTEVEYIKKGQEEIKREQREHRVLLQKIERAVNDGS